MDSIDVAILRNGKVLRLDRFSIHLLRQSTKRWPSIKFVECSAKTGRECAEGWPEIDFDPACLCIETFDGIIMTLIMKLDD